MVVRVVPDLRDVKRIEVVRRGIGGWHDLDLERPTRKLTRFNVIDQIRVVRLRILARDDGRFFVVRKPMPCWVLKWYFT